jgi:hypothetical protein
MKYENFKDDIEYNAVPQTTRSTSDDDLKIFLRDPLNKTIEVTIDRTKIVTIKDLKSHVNSSNLRFPHS